MIFGYARVSTQDQNLDRQLDALKAAGCERIFEEKITGTKKDRPEFQKLLDQLREGDVIVVSDLTRLSRSTKDLFEIVDLISKKKADIKSLKESWLDTTTPQGRFMFTIVAGVSQLERDLISQRTKEGLASARARGKKGGRPFSLSATEIANLRILYGSKQVSVMDICKQFKISKPTLYRYVDKEEPAQED